MRVTFKVRYDDGREVEAVAKPKDVVAFERQYGQSIAALGDKTPIEWLLYLAWSPLHRQGREPRAFDEFLNDVDDIDLVEGGEADPTQPAASAEDLPG